MNVPIFSLDEWDGHQVNCIIHASIESVLNKIQCKPRLTVTAPPVDLIPEDTYQKWLDLLCQKSGLVFWTIPAKQFERAFGVDPSKALGQIIWDKPDAVPFPKNKVIYHHDMIWIFGDRNLFTAPIKSVWTMFSVVKSKHPAPFPMDLPSRSIVVSTNKGDLVFDPFGGSGTTATVAKALGRNFLTCDISKQYCQWIKERIEKTKIV